MRHTPQILFAAALATLSAAPALAQLPTQKVLTFDLANEMAQEAIKVCRAYNQKITVAVVDSGNHLKALLRDDGADVATLDVARQKATTVILFGGTASSGAAPGATPGNGCNADLAALAARGAAPPAPAAPAPAPAPAAGAGAGGAPPGGGGGGFTVTQRFNVPGTTTAGGGHSVRIGDQVIGAVAVSGVTGSGRPVPQGDSGCTCAAIAKFADRLK